MTGRKCTFSEHSIPPAFCPVVVACPCMLSLFGMPLQSRCCKNKLQLSAISVLNYSTITASSPVHKWEGLLFLFPVVSRLFVLTEHWYSLL